MSEECQIYRALPCAHGERRYGLGLHSVQLGLGRRAGPAAGTAIDRPHSVEGFISIFKFGAIRHLQHTSPRSISDAFPCRANYGRIGSSDQQSY